MPYRKLPTRVYPVNHSCISSNYYMYERSHHRHSLNERMYLPLTSLICVNAYTRLSLCFSASSKVTHKIIVHREGRAWERGYYQGNLEGRDSSDSLGEGRVSGDTLIVELCRACRKKTSNSSGLKWLIIRSAALIVRALLTNAL